jgi:hypothetical protein
MGHQASKYLVCGKSRQAMTPSSNIPQAVEPDAKDATDEMPRLGSCKKARFSKLERSADPVPEALPQSKVDDVWIQLFGENAEEDDVHRWLSSTFSFVEGAEPQNGLRCAWGLKQELGGPCGVFAAVQAFIVRELLWSSKLTRTLSTASTAVGSDSDSDSMGADGSPRTASSGDVSPPSPQSSSSTQSSSALVSSLARLFEQVDHQELLAVALSKVLYAATPTSRYVWANVTSNSDVSTYTFSSANTLADWLVSSGTVRESPCPLMSFVFSLVLTRGMQSLRSDMDDPSLPLIGIFGHCSQELVNLCLTGRAVTNIFDGEVTFQDGEDVLTLKGIYKRPDVGFLSALEPLKLCEVGKFLKQPRFPVWVVGSASHYTVLFSGSCCINHHGAQADGPCHREVLCAACSSTGVKCLSAHLLHFNGRCDHEKPTLSEVHVEVSSEKAQKRYEPGPLPAGDQDVQLFAETIKTRWPQAAVSYPQQTGPPRIS